MASRWWWLAIAASTACARPTAPVIGKDAADLDAAASVDAASDAATSLDPDGGRSASRAPSAPSGDDIACGNFELPFDFAPREPEMTLTNAYWAMWFSYWAQRSDLPEVEATFASLGFGVYRAIAAPEAGVQAIVAGRDDAIVLAFRGSQEVIDWINNFDFANQSGERFGLAGRVHRGFSNALEAAWPAILTALEDAGARRGARIWITGHSLGGAMALLAAARLQQSERVALGPIYTFANPRAGDSEFALDAWRRVGERHYRFVHARDVVPRIPPAGLAAPEAGAVLSVIDGPTEALVARLDYRHTGQLHWIDETGALHVFRPMDDGEDRAYWRSVGDRGWAALTMAFEQGDWHDPLTYLCHLRRLAYGR